MPKPHASPLAPQEQECVRLALRLLTTARLIERRVDQLMRAKFGSTIARFDFLSALDRHGALSPSEISTYLLVTNGSVTGLMTRLRADGLIETSENLHDQRSQDVRLTAHGKAAFRKMAKAHAACVAAALADVPARERRELSALLDRTRASIRNSSSAEPAA